MKSKGTKKQKQTAKPEPVVHSPNYVTGKTLVDPPSSTPRSNPLAYSRVLV